MHRVIQVLAAIAIAVVFMAGLVEVPNSTHGQTNVTCGASYTGNFADGETLAGQGCIGYGSGITWYVFSVDNATYGGNYIYNYAQQSQAYGYDDCAGQPAEYDMGGDGPWTYDTYQATAGWYQGTYQGCVTNHYYEDFAAGYEMQCSCSSEYGANGWYIR